MAFIDISVPQISASQVAVRFADRFVAVTRGVGFAEPVPDAEDDVFNPVRMKSARLPPIDACQTTIFKELRDREGSTGRAPLEPAKLTEETQHTGLNARIGRLFRAH